MKQKEIYVNRKHVVLRIIIFAITLITGITLLSLYFTGILKYTKGYFKTEVSYENKLLINDDVSFYTYFDGNSASYRKYAQNLNSTYSNEYNYILKLLDSKNTYDGVINLAYINLNTDKDLKIEKPLYDILSDAYLKTSENKNYSLFSSSIYQTYEAIFLSTFNNNIEIEQTYLDRINEATAIINDSNNFNLEFKDNNVINLHVSTTFSSFINEHELTSSYLDLNILKDAYIIEYLAGKMKENNYLNSYFISSNGYIYSLDSYVGSMNLLTISADNIKKYSTYDIKGNSSYIYFNYFDSNNNRIYKNKDIYMYTIVNIKEGSCISNINSFFINSSSLSLVDKGYQLLNLTSFKSSEEINLYIKENSLNKVTYCIKEDIYSTEKLNLSEEKFKLHIID